MNFSMAFLVALAMAGAVVANASNHVETHSHELHSELKEFLHLVPGEKVHEIVHEYMKNDKEVQAVAKYMKSERYHKLLRKIASIKAVQDLAMYLHEAGLYTYDSLEEISENFELLTMALEELETTEQIKGRVAGLISDISSVLPVPKFKALYWKKMKSSPVFRKFIEHLKAPRFHELVNDVVADKFIKKLIMFAEKHGVVQAFKSLFTRFGVRFPLPAIVDDSELLRELIDLE